VVSLSIFFHLSSSLSFISFSSFSSLSSLNMSFPASFKDQGKNANDLLNKGFPSTDKYSWKVDLETTSANGVKITPFIQQLPSGPEGELKATFKASNINFTVAGNLKEDFTLEANRAVAVRGFKPALTVSTSTRSFLGDKLKLKPAIEYRHDLALINTSVELLLNLPSDSSESVKKPPYPKALFSAIFGYKEGGIQGGVEVEAATTTKDIKNLNGVLSYASSGAELSLFSKTAIGGNTILGANFFTPFAQARLGRDARIAGELTYDNGKKFPLISLGVLLRPDEVSTFKSRINSNGLLGVSFSQQWAGPLSITLSGEINVRDPHSTPTSHPLWGVRLSFK